MEEGGGRPTPQPSQGGTSPSPSEGGEGLPVNGLFDEELQPARPSPPLEGSGEVSSRHHRPTPLGNECAQGHAFNLHLKAEHQHQ